MLAAGPEPNYFDESDRHRRSLWAAVVAGFLAGLSIAILLCRTPGTTTSQMVVVLLAGAYLALTALFGTTGSYIYWLRSYARSAPGLLELLQSTVKGWVWIPALVLLFRKDSAWAPAVAAAGAAVLAVSLRRSGPLALSPTPAPAEEQQQEIFAQCLRRAPTEWSGPVIAVCVYGEALVFARGWLFAGCVFLALAAFLFAWVRTPAAHSGRFRSKVNAATLRQASSAIPALAVTVLAMLAGMGHDLHLWGMGLGGGQGHSATDLQKTQNLPAHRSLGGHVSIILLTAPQNQQFQVPRPTQPLLQGNRLNKPMVIQFDGEYWYFQPPDSGPGPGAYTSRDNPLTANIHSVLAIPLLMQAHQRLGSPLPLGCCHEVEVEIENRERTSGTPELAMSLSDSAHPGKSLLLGVQSVPSGQGDASGAGSAPAHQTLRFTIPAPSGPAAGPGKDQLRQFDQIDMLIMPSSARIESGAKIAVRTLKFMP
jgi:hypothetical protein